MRTISWLTAFRLCPLIYQWIVVSHHIYCHIEPSSKSPSSSTWLGFKSDYCSGSRRRYIQTYFLSLTRPPQLLWATQAYRGFYATKLQYSCPIYARHI